jgi:hypothetical protein
MEPTQKDPEVRQLVSRPFPLDIIIRLNYSMQNSLFAKAKFAANIAFSKLRTTISKVSREVEAAQYVEKNAIRGNPISVIAAFDQFCYASNWMMNVGCVFR